MQDDKTPDLTAPKFNKKSANFNRLRKEIAEGIKPVAVENADLPDYGDFVVVDNFLRFLWEGISHGLEKTDEADRKNRQGALAAVKLVSMIAEDAKTAMLVSKADRGDLQALGILMGVQLSPLLEALGDAPPKIPQPSNN